MKTINRPPFKNKKLNSAIFNAILVVLLLQTSLIAIAPFRNLVYVTVERVWRSSWLHGKRGLPRQFATNMMFSPTIPVWVEVEPNMAMFLDPNEFVQTNLMFRGTWEPETWDSMSNYLEKGGGFVDVGAHVGYYSLKAAKIVGSQGRVLAIEPNPDILPVLRKNIAANYDNIITIVPVACSDSDTTLEFFSAYRANSGGSSLSRANAEHYGTTKATYHVPARRLDAIIQENNILRVDIVKIDVEGAELTVLKGAQETLDRYHPVVYMELNEHLLNNMGTTVAEIIRWLQDRGYTAMKSISDEWNNTEFVYTNHCATTENIHITK